MSAVKKETTTKNDISRAAQLWSIERASASLSFLNVGATARFIHPGLIIQSQGLINPLLTNEPPWRNVCYRYSYRGLKEERIKREEKKRPRQNIGTTTTSRRRRRFRRRRLKKKIPVIVQRLPRFFFLLFYLAHLVVNFPDDEDN